MKNAELFNQLKSVQMGVQSLQGIVQNPMTPEQVDLSQFKEDSSKMIKKIEEWTNDVINYYENMTDEQKQEIIDEQDGLCKLF